MAGAGARAARTRRTTHVRTAVACRTDGRWSTRGAVTQPPVCAPQRPARLKTPVGEMAHAGTPRRRRTTVYGSRVDARGPCSHAPARVALSERPRHRADPSTEGAFRFEPAGRTGGTGEPGATRAAACECAFASTVRIAPTRHRKRDAVGAPRPLHRLLNRDWARAVPGGEQQRTGDALPRSTHTVPLPHHRPPARIGATQWAPYQRKGAPICPRHARTRAPQGAPFCVRVEEKMAHRMGDVPAPGRRQEPP